MSELKRRSFFKSLAGREEPKSLHRRMRGYSVRCSEDGVVAKKPTGEESAILWEHLETVIAQTHEPVPGLPNMMWILSGTRGACVVPEAARGEGAFIQWLEQLPGFRKDELTKAKACKEQNSFVLWERPIIDHDDD